MEGPIPDPATLDDEGDDDVVMSTLHLRFGRVLIPTSEAFEPRTRESQTRTLSLTTGLFRIKSTATSC